MACTVLRLHGDNIMAAPFLPVSKDEMRRRGINELDVIIVTGDAYVDHPAYGAAVIGRVLEAEGFTVGIIAQPGWHDTKDFTALGKPRLFFGITSGNVDSMVANYSAGKRRRKKLLYVVWKVRLTPPGIRETYRKRFGIETSYRQMNEARIRTCTRDPSQRLLFVGIALVLRNVWVWLHFTLAKGKLGAGLKTTAFSGWLTTSAQ